MPRLTANRVLALVLFVAVGLAATLIAVSVTGAGDDETSSRAVHGAAATQALLAGIPQRDGVLGEADAPVTLVEYADLQCPYCAQWAVDTFPALVDEYVRPGKVKVVFDGVPIIGADSLAALRAVESAGRQNRLWHMVELLYHNQGAENEGWVTDDLLRSIGESVPGLDVGTMMDDRESAAVDAAVANAQAEAANAGVSITPTFEASRANGVPIRLEGALAAAEFRRVLDKLLEQ